MIPGVFELRVSSLTCVCQEGAEFPEIFEGCSPIVVGLWENTAVDVEELLRVAAWLRCPSHESRSSEYLGRAMSVMALESFQPRVAKRYMLRALEETARDQLQAICLTADAKYRKAIVPTLAAANVADADQAMAHGLAHLESFAIQRAILLAGRILSERVVAVMGS